VHNRGTIVDIVSGKTVALTPEERCVQLLAKWLLSLGYRKEQLQTHPQYQIPSSDGDFYADVAIFADERRDAPPLAIAECKRTGKGRTEGLDQLRKYLRRTGAKLGYWFDGQDLALVVNIPGAAAVMGSSLGSLPEAECGAYIRSRREALQQNDSSFSLRQVAGRLGVQPAHLSKVEKGDVPASDELLSAIARELGEDRNALFIRAGRIAPEMREILVARPDFFAQLVRMLEGMSESQLKEVTRRVRDGKW
jgi:transcriptional regulator with XRE-family HTH domain